MITVERVICVVFPLQARVVCTKKWTSVAVASVVTSLFLVNSHILKYAYIQENGQCGLSTTIPFGMFDSYNDFWNNVWLWVDLVIYSVIPFTSIVACNCLLVYKVRQSKLKRTTLQDQANDAVTSRMTSMTRMLITVSLMFIILTSPVTIYFLIRGQIVVKTKRQSETLQLTYAITTIISLINHAINFLLYCVSGSQFRREVFLMFKGQKRVK
jgi:hypothetical protein